MVKALIGGERMKEVNCTIDNTIKMINSEVIGKIIVHSGYFEEVEDISNQVSDDNSMVFDVYVDLNMFISEPLRKKLDNMNKLLEEDEEGLIQKADIYMDIATEDIVSIIKEQLNIFNVTSSFSINQLDDGINALIYLFFGEYYLNQTDHY